jgi:sigma-B regulation protein RsbU (phosphoserine phosphatase)
VSADDGRSVDDPGPCAPELPTDDAESLYDRAPCGYLTTTADGTIVRVNQTFLDWTGHDRSDLVGRRTFASLLTAGGRIYHETHYAPMLRLQGSVRELALEIVRVDGSRLPALVNSVAELDASGAVTSVRIAVFDATERRSYERELLRAMRRAEESEARANALARTLQQTLIPPALPRVPGLDLAAAYRPAGSGEEVGGDFYDVFQVGPGDWVVAAGDVCGKGVDAAVVTAVARHTLRAAAVHEPDPRSALSTLNEVLLGQRFDRFCTVVFVRLRLLGGRWTATLAVGGHPLPLLCPRGGPVVPVGRPELHDVDVELASGDLLVLFTDGVTEGRRGTEWYGEARLARLVAVAPTADALVEAALDDVVRFQAGEPRDDIVIVAVRVP